jgi:hypothetical protein
MSYTGFSATPDEAVAELREMYPVGSSVTCVVLHVSKSGMSRAIMVISPEHENVSWLVARALDWHLHRNHNAVNVVGVRMDMTFHMVHSLALTLYGDGYALAVKRL